MKCFLTTRLLLLLIVRCCLFVIPAVLLGQTETRRIDQKPVLLAITHYGEQESERILSLWRISLGESSAFVTEGRTVDTPGLISPLTAFVLIDGTLESPFSGRLVWALKESEALFSQDRTIVSGSVLWQSAEHRAYLTIARSGNGVVRVQVFKTGTEQALASYSPLAREQDKTIFMSLNPIPEPFAKWRSDRLFKLGLVYVDVVQTVIEPESILVHLMDKVYLQRIHSEPNSNKGEIYVRLHLKNKSWTEVVE